MEKLTIEQKAKAYDKALERAKSVDDPEWLSPRDVAEYIFPELKENDNKRVRNKLIEFFKGYFPDKEWWGNITQKDILAWLEEHDEQKSWSKEDEMQLDAAIHLVSNTGHIETANWLKELKNRVQPQLQQGWSEEDEMMIKFTLTYFRTRGALENSDIIKWLKSLKDRIQPQSNQEWIKEAENNILFLTSIIEECFKDKEKITLCSDTACANFTKENVIDRLKSLRHQSTWKPSDEQFKLLKHIMENVPLSYRDKSEVGELYLDLKRLL